MSTPSRSWTSSKIPRSSSASSALEGGTRTRIVSPRRRRDAEEIPAEVESERQVGPHLPRPGTAGALAHESSRLPRDRCRVISIRPNSDTWSSLVRARSRVISSWKRSNSASR